MVDHPVNIRAVRTSLLRWFARHGRDLPWRRRPTAYAVWVSEIMLQQTQVATAEPYFRRWMKRFPSVRALARARLGSALKVWEGLGYYSRARNLHAAARMVVGEFGGRVPRDVAGLRKLPGVGRYTAGAIASIAFGLDEPVVDGNVTRVLCRLFAIAADAKAPRTQKRLWTLAGELLPPGEAGTFNEALMDLGATVCTPRSPTCGKCPLRKLCLARARGRQESLPRTKPRKPVPHFVVVAAVIYDKAGRILIDRRPTDSMLGGLWEFPGGKVEPGETLDDAVHRELAEEVGIRVTIGEEIVVVRHAYTHLRITMHAIECRHLSGRARAVDVDAVKWTHPADLARHAFPAANRRIIDAITEASR